MVYGVQKNSYTGANPGGASGFETGDPKTKVSEVI